MHQVNIQMRYDKDPTPSSSIDTLSHATNLMSDISFVLPDITKVHCVRFAAFDGILNCSSTTISRRVK